jgi:hypothetical protein
MPPESAKADAGHGMAQAYVHPRRPGSTDQPITHSLTMFPLLVSHAKTE